MADLALVYLARKAEGLEPIRRFAESYRRNPAGVPHELVVVFKGHKTAEDLAGAIASLGDLPHRAIRLKDKGYDIGAYFAAARQIETDRVCFLNTFSEILTPGWLAALDRHARRAGVGIVGATGSYESLYSSMVLISKVVWLCETRGSGADDRLVRYFRSLLAKAAPRRLDLAPGLTFLRKVVRRFFTFRLLVNAPRIYGKFPRFPNPHIRSNGFLLKRDLFLRFGGIGRGKRDAYAFESGRDNMTARILRSGLAALIVGADGNAYDVPQWPQSGIFRSGSQANLLIADNQTNAFMTLSAEERDAYACMTWGDRACPSLAEFPGLDFPFRIDDSMIAMQKA
jgi:hypothetical protein